MAKVIKEEITSMHEAKHAMNCINTCDNDLAEIYHEEAQAIAKVRVEFHTGKTNTKRQKLEAIKKEKEKQLKAWAKKDRENWNGKQSVKTAFGILGYRKGQNKVDLIKKVSKNWVIALEKISKLLPKYVRTKEEVNKEKILSETNLLTVEELQSVGIKIKQEEPFFIKTLSTENLEKATNELKSA